jgi:solute carrier family 13 (sodium-dependent dicarboxylate transporter), member 2/3/5
MSWIAYQTSRREGVFMADAQSGFWWLKWAGLIGGPILAIFAYVLLPDLGADAQGQTTGLSPAGKGTAAVGVLMGIWWLSEAIELPATALLPIALFPLLGITTISGATAPYANPVIFLFLGGFLLGLAMERWGLHRRIALLTILAVGTKPKRMVAGFMLATAAMSMWVSNTATAVMMMPIGISVIHLVFARLGRDFDKDNLPGRGTPGANFATCLMLGIAYSASIGGIGTLIGTPPNVLLAGYLRQTYDEEISFFRWMLLGVPLVAIFLPIAWLYLVSVAYPIRLTEIPGGRELVRGELADLGPMKRGEWVVLAVFLTAATLWITRRYLPQLPGIGPSLTGLSDEGIAIGAGLLLFVIPVNLRKRVFVMNWATAEKLPWGILLLFGGGLSLASAVQGTGVDRWIGGGFDIVAGAPLIVLVFAVAVLVIYLTEMTSNTAVTTAMLVVLGGASLRLGVPPEPLLIAAAIAASCAFMLPVATPPNAVVFGSGYVSLAQMVKAGFWLNIVGAVLVTILAYLLAGTVLGLDLSQPR